MLFALAGVLGVAFRQGRVTCIAVVALAAADRGGGGDRGTALSVSLALLPTAAAGFFAMRERGMLTRHGLVRLAMAGSFALAVRILPGSETFTRWMGRLSPGPAAAWCEPCPGLWAGILALAAAAAVLIIFRRTENPLAGPLLLAASVFVPAGIALGGAIGPAGEALSFSAAGAALCWAVLDSAWRHAHLDELTGLPGRRPLRHLMADISGGCTVGMVDIDFFKKVNDRFGHGVGDQVLKYVASALRQCEGARAFRYGGEEFTLVFTRGAFEDHLRAMDELRRSVEKKRFIIRSRTRPLKKPASPAGRPAGRAGKSLALTISIGAARSGGRRADADSVLKAADAALYRAKEEGRNRICHSRGRP